MVAAAPAVLAAACGGDDDGGAVVSTEETPTDASQPDTVEVDDAALQILDQWRTDVHAYGATLSLRVPGHDDIHLASGIDDRDPETPMPTDGTYSVASVTKSFVAATALQLVNEGRLSLDEPVEPWLPELPHADEVTLAMLLGHTAGLGPWDNGEVVIEDLTRSFTPEEVLAMQLQAPPSGQPRAVRLHQCRLHGRGSPDRTPSTRTWRRSSRNGSPSRSRCTTPDSPTAPSR